MNPHSGKAGEPIDARESITRVLEAERRMLHDLDKCRERAEAVVGDARSGARRILRRSEERIRLLHQRWEDAIDARVKAIESGFDASAKLNTDSNRRNVEELRMAVERLAERLTTAKRDDF